MRLHPRAFVRFLDGRAGTRIVIASLPGDLRRYLPAVTSDVSLGIEYARKINIKHRMRYESFDCIQEAIDQGCCRQIGETRLAFFHQRDPIRHEAYYLGIKCAANGHEIWLVTFHRITPGQLARKLREGRIVRDFVETFPE